MPALSFEPEALEALQHFREHDVLRGQAHDRALDDIEAGTAGSRAVWVESRGVYLTPVVIPGRDDEDLIVWLTADSGDAVIVHLGRAKL